MHGYSDLLQALTGEHLSPVGSLSTKVTLISASAVPWAVGYFRHAIYDVTHLIMIMTEKNETQKQTAACLETTNVN